MFIAEIAGHVGRDPETRFTPSGQKVTSFSVAANLRRNGKDETVWVRVTVWGDRFDKVMSFIKKGSAVIVIGELSQPPQIYTDKNGLQQVSVDITADIIKLSPFGRPDRPDSPQQQGYTSNPQQQGYTPQGQPYTSQGYVQAGAAAPAAASAAGYGTATEAFGESSYGNASNAYANPYGAQRGYGSSQAQGEASSQEDEGLPF